MADSLIYEIKDRVAYITLNRPDALNAQNFEMRRRLAEAMTDISTNPDVGVGIISGAGDRAFSTGMDLKERAKLDAAGVAERLPEIPSFVDKPVIAAIHGYCVAAGFELALRCDIRIASPDAQFGLPEPRWSLIAGYGLHNLNRLIPLGEALHMQLTGDRISAQRAYDIGLVQRLVPRERLLDEARKIADSVLLCAPMAVRAIKKIVMTGRNLPVEYSWELARPIEEKVLGSQDAIEGPRAFSEKRRPNWKGQ